MIFQRIRNVIDLKLTAIVRYDIFFRHVRVSDRNLIHQIIYILEILKLFLSSDGLNSAQQDLSGASS